MFSGFANVVINANATLSVGPPKDIPAPTPISLPRCNVREDGQQGAIVRPAAPLPIILQGITRLGELNISHLRALGVHVTADADPAIVIPDASYIPEFASWDALSLDEVYAADDRTRRLLNNGAKSPGCWTYRDRKRELTVPNSAAFRIVRRLAFPRGQPPVRLGNSFEFYRCLNLFANYWEDTSKPAISPAASNKQETGSKTASPDPPAGDELEEREFYRTQAGHMMPAEYRQQMLAAFVKLVAYDFGCNMSTPRVEPRLYVRSILQPDPALKRQTAAIPLTRTSHFPAGCQFVFRMPRTREEARAGFVEGPVVAVSARYQYSFAPPCPQSSAELKLPSPSPSVDKDSLVDFSRELVAALTMAQHRAREGRIEQRLGKGAWWATKSRWGGGTGGPIGREVYGSADLDQTVGEMNAPPTQNGRDSVETPEKMAPNASFKGPKRLKSSNQVMYDNYRMVRPPPAAWDSKTRYQAIGRVKGVDYDDIFVTSSILHHIAVVRVRVPDRLLEVLNGAEYDPQQLSWGRLKVYRSRWYDVFKPDDRVAAMELIWSMMAYLMREDTRGCSGNVMSDGRNTSRD